MVKYEINLEKWIIGIWIHEQKSMIHTISTVS